MEPGQTATADSNNKNVTIKENGIAVKELDDKKVAGKHNPKLSVFREFVLATAHSFAEEHAVKQSGLSNNQGGRRQFFACDLIAQSGIAGLQWKRHVGDKIHVTVVEQRDPQPLQDNVQENGFTVCPLPLDFTRPAGTCLPEQSSSQLHLAQCDPVVLLELESFDFVYVDPHKNPAPYFSSVFRNVRNDGVVCFVVPDTMHFARSPHVVRRCYGAHCMKTEYLKELAVRIILATLATEAARCSKGLTVLYAVSLEDFLLLAVRVGRGPKLADDMLQQNIGHVLHCRICEERAFYPAAKAPVEDPYSLISCECHKNVPGKTGVILGPLWKGSIYDYACLSSLAVSGRSLHLSSSFFALLHRVMEDCLCDTPPSLHSLQTGSLPQHHCSDELPPSVNTAAKQTEAGKCTRNRQNGDHVCSDGKEDVEITSEGGRAEAKVSEMDGGSLSISNAGSENVAVPDDVEMNSEGDRAEAKLSETSGGSVSNSARENDAVLSSKLQSASDKFLKDLPTDDSSVGESRQGVKRPASVADLEVSTLPSKRSKGTNEPAPCFFYNMHSKRLGTNHLPKHQAVVERLRSHGYRCCRTHFEKYAIRTNADMKMLTGLLGTCENKVLYVKGSQQNV